MPAPVRLVHPANPLPAPARPGDRHACRWLSVRVELVSGGPVGALWPPPGRYLLANPEHSFADLAEAIDVAFARWDLRMRPPGRVSGFDAPGWHVRDPDSHAGTDPAARVDPGRAVGDLLAAGDKFTYTFDINDGCWRHDCAVVADDTDPLDMFGRVLEQPTPYYGWGVLPDQHGRLWLDPTDTAPPPPEHLDRHLQGRPEAVITVAERRAMITTTVR